ncbi:MAG: FAD-binding protein [Chloroflexi bacterium]|nr:FAD-binding protein [Chloroflexota bacterium]
MLSEKTIEELRGIVGGEHVHIGPAELVAYSYDATFQQHRPDVAVSPACTEEVVEVMKLAYREVIPVVARGASTGLAGGTIPVSGGILLNLARMNKVIEIDKDNAMAVVQAGVVTAQLQKEVEKVGLFYPPDPASLNQCTIGGNVACNAGGPRCLKYGVTRHYVLGLTVVLADGRVLRCGGKLMKNSTGYQLPQLFIGSEGTLGVVTEVILRLLPLPRVRSTATAFFSKLEDASRSVAAIIASGILPATLELMDNVCINASADYLSLDLPRDAQAMLILEQDGNDEAAVRKEVERMAEVVKAQGAFLVKVAATSKERDDLWKARRGLGPALGRLSPNRFAEDITVAPGRIPEMVHRLLEIGKEFGFQILVFGHAGDGNLHPSILFDNTKPGVMEQVEKAAEAIFDAALELGGTLSGEHGIGTLKREFMEDALGPVALSVMKDIKKALDPKGILNPQKVFPQRASRKGFIMALPTLGNDLPG